MGSIILLMHCRAVAQRANIHSGGIMVGKTNMDQFAAGLVGTRTPFGNARNAFDDRFIPGGSSSGSGALVGSGLVSFALGTDTAGSGGSLTPKTLTSPYPCCPASAHCLVHFTSKGHSWLSRAAGPQLLLPPPSAQPHLLKLSRTGLHPMRMFCFTLQAGCLPC